MPTVAEYAAWKARQQQSNVGKANIVLGQDWQRDPDQYAGDLSFAKEATAAVGNPVPLTLVQDPDTRSVFERIVAEKKQSTILTQSPVLADWLRTPTNAALARDDLEGLSWWEKMGKSFQVGNATAITHGQEFTRDAAQALEASPLGQAYDAAGDAFDAALLTNPDGTPNYLGQIANLFRSPELAVGASNLTAEQKSELIANADMSPIYEGARTMLSQIEAEGFAPTSLGDVNSFGTAAQFVADNLAMSAPQMLTAIASGALAPLLQVAMLGGEANSELKARTDLPVDKRIAISTSAGVVMTALETFGLGKIFGGVPLGSVVGDAVDGLLVDQLVQRGVPAVAARALEAALAEGTTEALQEGIVVGVTALSGGEYTPDEILGRLAEAFVAGGAVGGSLRAGVETPAAVQRMGQRLTEQQGKANAAEGTVTALEEIAAAATASVTRNRSPDVFRDFINTVTANGGRENMFVPADAFTEYFQSAGIDPFELADQLAGMGRADLQTAIETGGAVKIPTATWAADMAGSEHDQFIIQNSAFSPDDMTGMQAAEFEAVKNDLLAEAWAEAEAARQDADALRAVYDQEREQLVGALRAAGRATDVATAEALPLVAFRRTMAERMGLTPEEFAARYPLPEVRGERPEGLDPKNVDALTRTLAEARARRSVGLDRVETPLLEFISERGGITDPGGELAARDAAVVKRRGRKTLKLERRSLTDGMASMFGIDAGQGQYGMDNVARAAVEAGFMADDPDVLAWQEAMRSGGEAVDLAPALLRAIDAELRAEPEAADDLGGVEEYLAGLGVSLDDADADIRAAIEGSEGEGRAYGQSSVENLIVQHNLSAANLLHADKMRGLAVPSVAISNVDHPLDGFGEITLLGGPDLIDPRKDSASKVFDADVYSPRYPTVRYKVASKPFDKVWKRLGDVSAELGHVLSGEIDHSEVERKGLEAFRDSSAVQLQFLRDTGRSIDLPQQSAKTTYLTKVPEIAEFVGEYTTPYEVMQNPDAVAAIGRAIDMEVAIVLDARGEGFTADEVRGWYYDKDGDIRRNVIDAIQQEIRVSKRPGVDRSAARQALREAVQPVAAEFAAWVEGEFGSVLAGETIETQTASGDWKYLPHTLDNVVKVLRRKLRDGEGWNYGVASIRSNVANQFKSVSAIKAARGKLIPSDAMQALKDESNDEFSALAGVMEGYAKHKMGYGFLDAFSEHLKEVAERGVRSLDQYYDGLSDEQKQAVVAFLDKLANMPTEYFEAKIQRAVDISEFKAAVIPTTTDKAVRDVLLYARVPVIEYDSSKPGARAAAIRQASGEQRLLFQADAGFQGGGSRGSIQFPGAGVSNGQTIISLFQSADLSTFLHESGHYFLTVLQDMARLDPSAPVAAEYEAIRNWWRDNADAVAKDAGPTVTADDVRLALDNGSTGDAAKDQAIDTGMQEQFARATEQYLLEGKAPSQDLRAAFEKFHAWLLSIYRNLRGLNVNVTDELRGVFDRLLATDAEIDAARADIGADVNLTADDLGMTPEQFEGFVKLRDQARDEAKAKLLAQTMAPIQRAREKWFKDERKKAREEVARDMNAQPVYRAIEWMGNRRWLGDTATDMPEFRLSKSVLVDRYGEGVLSTLPRGMQTVYAVDGGLDPDDVAGWFGFSSGDALVQAMERAPKRVEAIEAETDVKMRERHGDVLRDGSVEALATEAVHNDKRSRVLAAELAALNDIAGTDRGLTAMDARESARRTLSQMTTRDALRGERFLAAERKAAAEVARLTGTVTREGMWMDRARRKVATQARGAVREGDGSAALTLPVDRANQTTQRFNEDAAALVEAKRRQLMNHALYSESLAIADEVASAERLVDRLAKALRRRRAQEGKQTVSHEHLDAIAEIIERYDFRKMSGPAEQRRGALNRYVEAMVAAGRENELAIPKKVLEDAARVPYRTLSVSDLRGVVDSLRNLESMGRRWQKLLIAKKQRELDEAVDTIVTGLRDNVGSNPGAWVDVGWKTTAKGAVNQYLSTFTTATTVLRKIDGREDLGPVYELLKSDIDDAAYSEREMREKAAGQIEALYSVYSRDEQRQMAVLREWQGVGTFSKWNLISMALNMGNEGNLQRLTNKNARQHLTPAQVETVKGLLDKRDWDFVQSVWDYLDTYRPMIAERQKRVTGVEPEWVDATAVQTPVGTYRGGYYPIKYSSKQGGASTPSVGSENDIIKSMQAGSYSKAATKNGHLEARVAGVQQSLLLDVGVIAQHTNEVIHDLTFSEPIVNTWRLLNDQRVSGAFIDAGMQEQHDALKLWLKDAAVGQVFASDVMSRIMRNLRSGFTVSRLAFNLGTAALQPTGLLQSAAVVGKRNLANAVMRYMRDPVATTNEVVSRSRIMRERRTTFQKDLMDMVAETNMASPTSSRFKDVMNRYAVPASLAAMTYTQFYVVDVPTWAAAYDRGMRQFDGNQDKAAQYADMTVARVQGSGLWSDRSNIERGTLSASLRQSPFVTLFTTLGSYFFAKMNLLMERTDALRSEPVTAAAAASYAFDVGLLLAGEAAVALLLDAGKDALFGGDGEDEDENPAMTLGTEAMKVFAAGLPGIRDGVSVYQGFSGGTYAGILDLLVKPAKQTAQGEFDAALVKSFVNVAGVMARLPAAQANRIIDAGWRDIDGEVVPAMEYLFGRPR